MSDPHVDVLTVAIVHHLTGCETCQAAYPGCHVLGAWEATSPARVKAAREAVRFAMGKTGYPAQLHGQPEPRPNLVRFVHGEAKRMLGEHVDLVDEE